MSVNYEVISMSIDEVALYVYYTASVKETRCLGGFASLNPPYDIRIRMNSSATEKTSFIRWQR